MRSIHGEAITAICCRRRFDDLLAAFKQATLKALRSSGTEEEYNKRDQLLQGIVDLIDAAATKKNTLEQVQDKRETDGHLIHEAAIVSMKRKAVDDERLPVVATFTEMKMMLESNKIKAEEVATKKEEIMLAQQKLELERARYELDKAERENRFALEKKEREVQMEFMRSTIEMMRALTK
ncbi:hypothetical protein H310_04318 [Aphanomyces invadans]|uniref:Uncharacterized protein n=2 Tax=Aphanomyces invadans TaxID=157072 RepID=A0A024UE79_9STRA|nr:hypothetical protein H310_04318 [Aphanomyces invadans]ETW03893.1 hypothetical protein H310_04318 [Aphanomyces invadans]|eukprot:XP_008866849.1 hypothetical protein H310_04318 [Aphanomyces invadans]